MGTYHPRPEDLTRHWYVVDATDQPLGRLASVVAMVIRGKHTPHYAPSVDTGDFVIVINADKVKLTGNKLDGKFHYQHSGAPGGLRAEAYRDLLVRRPMKAIERAVLGMLPKNRLGRTLRSKLKVYPGPTHPHVAQKPEAMNLKNAFRVNRRAN